MPKEPEKQKVVMAKRIANRWIRRVAKSEYRLTVYQGAKGSQNIANFLRSFRDGKVAMQGVPPLSDLGVRDHGDSIEIWTTHREAMVQIKDWFEKRGYETTGVW
ncbi:MAG: hypothetical protein WC824_08165 [Bacteroidota bacterium]|jgi:hypothetical protein